MLRVDILLTENHSPSMLMGCIGREGVRGPHKLCACMCARVCVWDFFEEWMLACRSDAR